MKSLTLPINSKPPIISYLYHAYPFSIISTDNNYLDWFYSNYIQLICTEDMATNRHYLFDFFNRFFFYNYPQGFPHIKSTMIKRKLLIENYKGGVIQFVIDNLRQGRYVYTWVDEYDLQDRGMYQKEHGYHDILFYGFDLVKNTLESIGFNKEQQFASSTISFDQLRSLENVLPNWDIKLFILEKNDEFQFDLDISLITNWMQEYLFSVDSNQRLKPLTNYISGLDVGFSYGINTTSYLIEYIYELVAGNNRYDVRPFHVLYEHKRTMLDRIKHLESRKIIATTDTSEQYQAVYKQFNIIRNLMMKYSITGRVDILMNVIELIKDGQKKEVESLQRFLDKLNWKMTVL